MTIDEIRVICDRCVWAWGRTFPGEKPPKVIHKLGALVAALDVYRTAVDKSAKEYQNGMLLREVLSYLNEAFDALMAALNAVLEAE